MMSRSVSFKPRKLIIQIPCFNEERSLPITLRDLPRHVDGYDIVEWLVIDDGSTDATSQVARAHGVDHIVRLPANRGLAVAFTIGLERCIALGADTIVNTDADNQYVADCIPDLVRPILDEQALFVVGARPIGEVSDFSPAKKILQFFGSWVVRVVSNTKIPDAPSGFRAIHRTAAAQLNVFNPYTYTLETIIQAGRRGIPITSVPIRVNRCLRPSRLISSIPRYIQRSILIIFRIFVLYKPLRFFTLLGLAPAVIGFAAVIRFLVYYFSGHGQGNVQSLVIGTALLVLAALLTAIGILGDLISCNRRLLEDMRAQNLLRTDSPPPQEDPALLEDHPRCVALEG